jgi:hypothetical protein
MKIYICWDLILRFLWKSTEVSEEHIASVFRVRKQAKHETSVKKIARCMFLTDYTALYPRRYNSSLSNTLYFLVHKSKST